MGYFVTPSENDQIKIGQLLTIKKSEAIFWLKVSDSLYLPLFTTDDTLIRVFSYDRLYALKYWRVL